MKVQFKKSFLKDIKVLGDPTIKKRIGKSIAQAEEAAALGQVENLKKLKGGEQYYRIRGIRLPSTAIGGRGGNNQ